MHGKYRVDVETERTKSPAKRNLELRTRLILVRPRTWEIGPGQARVDVGPILAGVQVPPDLHCRAVERGLVLEVELGVGTQDEVREAAADEAAVAGD